MTYFLPYNEAISANRCLKRENLMDHGNFWGVYPINVQQGKIYLTTTTLLPCVKQCSVFQIYINSRGLMVISN